jgi:hypothetical protein
MNVRLMVFVLQKKIIPTEEATKRNKRNKAMIIFVALLLLVGVRVRELLDKKSCNIP